MYYWKKINIILAVFLSFSSIGLAQTNVNLTCNIHAEDLSEDGNIFSSGNDELLLIVYDNNGGLLYKPMITKTFELDQNNNTFQFNASVTIYDTLLIVLIENDSESYTERIEPSIRIYHKEIEKLFEAKKADELERYMGDEDLLIFKRLPLVQEKTTYEINASGFQNLDKYNYSITIDTN